MAKNVLKINKMFDKLFYKRPVTLGNKMNHCVLHKEYNSTLHKINISVYQKLSKISSYELGYKIFIIF